MGIKGEMRIRMNKTETVVIDGREQKLLPCPFCGSAAKIQPWHGGGPRKRLISCTGEFCAASPSVAGSTRMNAAKIWNTRV